MKATYCVLSLIFICFLRRGQGAVDLANPPSGSVIANFEGAQNVSTLICNVLNSGGARTTTAWFLQDFRSNPGRLTAIAVGELTELFFFSGDVVPNTNITYRNELTFLNFTSDLDGVTVFCGTAINRQQANFSLRVYRPPALRDNFLLRVEENNGMVPVDLTEGFAAFPEPSFSWTRNGQPFPGLNYSTVVFDNVEREDAGNYNVSATNFILNSTTEQVGTDTGSFYLDVLYGPTFQMQGPTQRYVLINNTLSLICGTGLDSNPQASVTWTAPDGTTIMDNARYDLENGPEIVRLNFTHTILSDTGTWKCRVVVMSEQYIVSGGMLVRQDNARIGELITVDIELTVISPPGQPRTLSLEDAGATSLRVCWDAPFNFDSSISFYTINARNLNSSEGMDELAVTNTSTNATFFNVTGLLPGTTYELTVVAVSQGGDVVATSEPSTSMVVTTELTVPALMCNDLVFEEGGITVAWSYIHTGGQPLDSVSVSYTFEEGSTVSGPVSVTVSNAETTMVNVPRLGAGVRYTFRITARNSIGSSYIMCEPKFLEVGIPATPTFGELTSGPNSGEVTIEIKTIASGVSSSSQGFQFNIIPVRDGVEGTPQEFVRNDYKSGQLETLVVRDLEQGQSYTFSATAMNFYGTSDATNSAFVTASGPRPTTSAPAGSSDSGLGAVIGGSVGGVLAVVVIVAIVIVVIAVILVVNRGSRDYHPNKGEGVKYHHAPMNESTVKVVEVPIDIGEDVNKKPRDGDNEIQYAELESFRPPSREKNGATEAKPIQPEEPVEYAVITTFKKIDDTPAAPKPASPPPPAADDGDKAGTSTTLV